MAFNTKLDLCDGKFYQSSGQTLGLSGTTSIGKAHYIHNECAYFNSCPRAIPDTAWVTGKTSSGIQTANNGLTKIGQNVVLGGSLAGDTTINAGVHAFAVCGSNSNSYISLLCAGGNVLGAINVAPNSGDYLSSYFALGTPTDSCIEIATSNPSHGGCGMLRLKDTAGQGSVQLLQKNSGGTINDFLMSSGVATYTDNANSKGIVYGGNYEANFTALSLVTKQYVCGQTSGITGCAITTAANGLTKAGQQVKLGGTLTGGTTLTANNGSSLTFTDSRTTPIGIQYGGDYCSTFTARSLVDAGYVTGKTACSEVISPVAITGVTNGLTKVGAHQACLGGNVTTSVSVTPVAAATVTVGTGTNKLIVSTGCTAMCNQTGNEINLVTVCGTQVGLSTLDAVASKFAYQTLCGTLPSICTRVANATCDVIICQQPNSYTIDACSVSFPGAQYVADYSANFTARSLVDKAFVTGCTNALCTGFVCSANNGLTKQGNNVKLGGALTGNTCICGAYNLGINVNQTNISGATGGVNIGGNALRINSTIPGSGGLLCIGAGNQICQTSLSAFGGLTGATNGLHTSGQRVLLGGQLTEDTNIQGAYCFDIDGVRGFNVRVTGNTNMNIDAQNCGGFLIKSQTGSVDTYPDFTCAVGFLGEIDQPNGFRVYDNRSGTGQTGIQYASDYSLNYVPRSLVDKQYVDSVATGLNVHQAVCAATTGPITLSGNQLIDGFMTSTGNRILVKDQVAGATNGIYSANTGSWGRTADYQTNTQITNGDLIPVTSGSTQNSSIWVLVTPEPITVGVTPLDYSEFSTVIDVQAGNGITIVQSGGVHVVSVQLASNCGLTFCGSGLAVNPNIAGIGLTYGAGILNVNAAVGGAVSSVPVKYNVGNCLVINCSDIASAVGAITGATNGLTKQAQQVKLGGSITGATTLTLSSGGGSLLFTDSRVGSAAVGIQYTADYGANFTARSIPDAAWVTGKTTTAGIQTANNGLTKQGTNVRLGGLLTGNTTICGASGFSLSMGGTVSPLKCFNVCATCNVDVEFGVTKCFSINTPTTPYLVISEIGGCDQACLRNKCGSCFGVDATCLNIVGSGGAMTVSDTASKGLVYADNYDANFTDLSLVDKFYVNNAITGSTLLYVNGLTHTSNKICLGGTLTGDTAILGSSQQLIFMGSGTAGTAQLVFNAGNVQGRTELGTQGLGAETYVKSQGKILELANSGATFSDSSSKGIEYAGDYEANFVARSLVTAQYVTGKTSCGITTASNGLTKLGQNVVLGGTLTGSTTIDTSTNNFTLSGGSITCIKTTNINLCGTEAGGGSLMFNYGGGGLHTILRSCNGGVLVSHCSVSTYAELDVTIGGSTFTDTQANSTGLKYGADYSADYVARSLVDAAYVTGKTSCGITTASNGLTKLGQNVVLGGTLTGSTTIDTTNSANLTMYDGNGVGLVINGGYSTTLGNVNSTCAYINTDGASYVNSFAKAVSVCLDGSSLNAICMKTPNATVEVDGFNGYVAISGATKLLKTPDDGLTTDSVIVWNSVDKELKKVAGSSLGDKNNIYAKQTISSSPVTLTTGSSYVQLVNVGTPATINLPVSPIDGQAFKIKDISGDALTNNITVVGAVDDGSNALINTDFGALELVWNNSTSKWYSLAFVN